jgi:hypothetical protein
LSERRVEPGRVLVGRAERRLQDPGPLEIAVRQDLPGEAARSPIRWRFSVNRSLNTEASSTGTRPADAAETL